MTAIDCLTCGFVHGADTPHEHVDLPWSDGSTATRNGAVGRGKCRRHEWVRHEVDISSFDECSRCGAVRDPAASRRGRTNRSRGNRAELDIAREIPGARKMGPLGLPWDVEVGEYARLQVKKLVARPSANAIRKLIEAIPDTGDRLRGFVWVEAAGRGKRGRREVWFLIRDYFVWHGDFLLAMADGKSVPESIRAEASQMLVRMDLADWVKENVR